VTLATGLRAKAPLRFLAGLRKRELNQNFVVLYFFHLRLIFCVFLFCVFVHVLFMLRSITESGRVCLTVRLLVCELIGRRERGVKGLP